MEILVVNNGTAEETSHVCDVYRDRLPVRYLRHDKPTVGEVLNRAWREAESEWVAYLDDDSLVYPTWTSAILGKIPILEPACFAMAGNVAMGPNPPPLPDWCHPKFAQSAYCNTYFGTEDRYLHYPDSSLGNNMGVRKSHPARHGGFPNELRTYWENYITWLGYWEGGTCFFNFGMRVAHIPASGRLTKKWAFNKTRTGGRNYQHALRLLRDHRQCPPAYDFIVRLPVAAVKLMVSWIIGSKHHITAFQGGLNFEYGRIEEWFRKAPPAEYSTFQKR